MGKSYVDNLLSFETGERVESKILKNVEIVESKSFENAEREPRARV